MEAMEHWKTCKKKDGKSMQNSSELFDMFLFYKYARRDQAVIDLDVECFANRCSKCTDKSALEPEFWGLLGAEPASITTI